MDSISTSNRAEEGASHDGCRMTIQKKDQAAPSPRGRSTPSLQRVLSSVLQQPVREARALCLEELQPPRRRESDAKKSSKSSSTSGHSTPSMQCAFSRWSITDVGQHVCLPCPSLFAAVAEVRVSLNPRTHFDTHTMFAPDVVHERFKAPPPVFLPHPHVAQK